MLDDEVVVTTVDEAVKGDDDVGVDDVGIVNVVVVVAGPVAVDV